MVCLQVQVSGHQNLNLYFVTDYWMSGCLQLSFQVGLNSVMGEQQRPPGQETHPTTHGLKMEVTDHYWRESTCSGLHKCRARVHPVIFHRLKQGRERLILAYWQHLSLGNSWFDQGYDSVLTRISIWSIVRGVIIVILGRFSCLQFFCISLTRDLKLNRTSRKYPQTSQFIYLRTVNPELQGTVSTATTD